MAGCVVVGGVGEDGCCGGSVRAAFGPEGRSSGLRVVLAKAEVVLVEGGVETAY